MKLSLRRKFKDPKYTIGDLSIDGTFFCNTIGKFSNDILDSVTEKCAVNTEFANSVFRTLEFAS